MLVLGHFVGRCGPLIVPLDSGAGFRTAVAVEPVGSDQNLVPNCPSTRAGQVGSGIRFLLKPKKGKNRSISVTGHTQGAVPRGMALNFSTSNVRFEIVNVVWSKMSVNMWQNGHYLLPD